MNMAAVMRGTVADCGEMRQARFQRRNRRARGHKHIPVPGVERLRAIGGQRTIRSSGCLARTAGTGSE